MLIDTHCHLNDPKFTNDLKDVITNAKKAGIKKFIVPGYDYATSIKSIELSNQYNQVIFASIGFHPYEAQHVTSIKPLNKLIKSNSSKSVINPYNILAIGECGLDYHEYKGFPAIGKKDSQKILFEEQCQLALKLDLPIIIHCRDAFEDLFNILDCLPKIPKGVIHCFSGGLQDIRFAQKRGLYIGIDGNITYSKHLLSIISQIPLSSLILESDSPYLTPEPYRGNRNEPKYLILTAKKIAEATNQNLEIIKDNTWNNSHDLFFKMSK
jgi:TatD DNase family protein